MVEKIFIISFFSYGYCATFWEGMLFNKIGNWAENNLPKYLWMPLGGCAICNAFWTGTAIYWIMWANDWKEWLLICIASIGVNASIVNLSNKIESISDKMYSPDD